MLRFTSAWEDVRYVIHYIFSAVHWDAVYSNSVLATLNARIAIRGLGEDSDELSFSLQTATKSCQPAFNTTSFLVRSYLIHSYFQRNLHLKQRPANISIKINTTQELTRDHQHSMRDLEVSR